MMSLYSQGLHDKHATQSIGLPPKKAMVASGASGVYFTPRFLRPLFEDYAPNVCVCVLSLGPVIANS